MPANKAGTSAQNPFTGMARSHQKRQPSKEFYPHRQRRPCRSWPCLRTRPATAATAHSN